MNDDTEQRANGARGPFEAGAPEQTVIPWHTPSADKPFMDALRAANRPPKYPPYAPPRPRESVFQLLLREIAMLRRRVAALEDAAGTTPGKRDATLVWLDEIYPDLVPPDDADE